MRMLNMFIKKYGTYSVSLIAKNDYGSDIITNSITIKLDYKNYIGKYQAREYISSYGLPEYYVICGEPFSLQRDIVITVDFGLTDSTLSVLGRDVYLDATGWYYDYHYSLRLWNDSIQSYYMNGGLECGQNEYLIGHRISENP